MQWIKWNGIDNKSNTIIQINRNTNKHRLGNKIEIKINKGRNKHTIECNWSNRKMKYEKK